MLACTSPLGGQAQPLSASRPEALGQLTNPKAESPVTCWHGAFKDLCMGDADRDQLRTGSIDVPDVPGCMALQGAGAVTGLQTVDRLHPVDILDV